MVLPSGRRLEWRLSTPLQVTAVRISRVRLLLNPTLLAIFATEGQANFFAQLCLQVTREVYVHSVPSDARNAVEKLESVLIGPKRTQVVEIPKPVTSLIQ